MSRALNRGYARSPFRWPIDFALLNNDVTWVYDEVQLLGEALATSTQLAAFRKEFTTFGKTPSVWMSATFDESWLNTVDFKEKPVVIELNADDLEIETVQKRYHASKSIEADERCNTPKGCAQYVTEQHREETLTLVITNTVLRAQEIWDELRRTHPHDLFLLHSRFRPVDREGIVDAVLTGKSGIVVSTQVIEAGIDIDADLMVTDVAPWPSLVQRFGRVNRYGNKNGARIVLVDEPMRGKSKLKDEELVLPYELDAVNAAREHLRSLRSASPANLSALPQTAPYKFVLRKADLLDLFDTTPDLTGNHIDVSRFVRSGRETNVYVAWRRWPDKKHFDRERIAQQELCPVPIGKDLLALLKETEAWTWNFTGRGKWESVERGRLYPGMRILLRCEAGNYEVERGWAFGSKKTVLDRRVLSGEESANDSDARSEGPRQPLDKHTDEVVTELDALLLRLGNADVSGFREALGSAARYHDWGKAHPVFQKTMHGGEALEGRPQEILAKSETGKGQHSRKGFRHELGSALAMLQISKDDLAAYVVAAHHGRVRTNIRSLPGEVDFQLSETRTARGIKEGDVLFWTELGGGVREDEQFLTLGAMELGANDTAPGWSDRVLALVERFGPFRLAYLETLLRTADERASAKGKEKKA